MELEYCSHCKKLYYSASLVRVANTGEVICLSCARYYDDYKRCEECGEVFDASKELMTWIGTGGYVCQDCYSRCNYVACYECGDVFREEDMQYNRMLEDYLCPACAPIPYELDRFMWPVGGYA